MHRPARTSAFAALLAAALLTTATATGQTVNKAIPENPGPTKMSQAVDRGLAWLAGAAQPDGGFRVTPPAKDGEVRAADIEATAWALLAFLANENTLRQGPHKKSVRGAVNWLRERQDGETGAFRASDGATCGLRIQALATIAIVECYGLSQYRLLQKSAQRATSYLVAQQGEDGGWSDTGTGASDALTTATAAFACASARSFELEVPRELERTVLRCAGQLTPLQKATPRLADLGATLLTFYFLAPRTLTVEETETAARQLAAAPPDPPAGSGEAEMLRWYFTTYALYQHGGAPFRDWYKHVRTLVLPRERTDGDLAGSFDPLPDGKPDRVVATAISTLVLNALDRYLRSKR